MGGAFCERRSAAADFVADTNRLYGSARVLVDGEWGCDVASRFASGVQVATGRLWSSENDAGRGLWLEPGRVARGPCNRETAQIHDTPMPQPLGEQLKGLFDHFSSDPMPDRLLSLADALEEAFQRGELHKKT